MTPIILNSKKSLDSRVATVTETPAANGGTKRQHEESKTSNSASGDVTSDITGYVSPVEVVVLPPHLSAANMRSFRELEKISFTSPHLFTSAAFAIAATRGVQLSIADDRTFKVTSAYLHLCCSFKNKQCPFILKLTKSKEGGGWVMKTDQDFDVDVKQRSNYYCQHGPTEYGTVLSGPSLKPKSKKQKLSQPSPRKTESSPKRPEPTPRKQEVFAKKPIIKSMEKAKPRDLISKPVVKPATSTPTRPLGPLDRSKALLSKIEPVLSPYNKGHPHISAPAPPTSAINNVMYADPRNSYNQNRNAKQSTRPHPKVYQPPNYTKPLPKPSATLPAWTAFLTLLDPELINIASILADPKLDASPASFLAEDDEILIAFLDSLDLPAWPKLKLKTKIIKNGREVWKMIESMPMRKMEEILIIESSSSSESSTSVVTTPVIEKTAPEVEIVEDMKVSGMGTGVYKKDATNWKKEMIIPPFARPTTPIITSVPEKKKTNKFSLMEIPKFGSKPKAKPSVVKIDMSLGSSAASKPLPAAVTTPLIAPIPKFGSGIPGIGKPRVV